MYRVKTCILKRGEKNLVTQDACYIIGASIVIVVKYEAHLVKHEIYTTVRV
jgi:hypothetical protein